MSAEQHLAALPFDERSDRDELVGFSLAPRQQDCAGSFLAGSDLWMVHAWVVPGHESRWGPFAVDNPTLCPPAAATPDIARCPTR